MWLREAETMASNQVFMNHLRFHLQKLAYWIDRVVLSEENGTCRIWSGFCLIGSICLQRFCNKMLFLPFILSSICVCSLHCVLTKSMKPIRGFVQSPLIFHLAIYLCPPSAKVDMQSSVHTQGIISFVLFCMIPYYLSQRIESQIAIVRIPS